MKITIECYGSKYTIESEHDDQNAEGMVDIFRKVMSVMGFHPDTINDCFTDE